MRRCPEPPPLSSERLSGGAPRRTGTPWATCLEGDWGLASGSALAVRGCIGRTRCPRVGRKQRGRVARVRFPARWSSSRKRGRLTFRVERGYSILSRIFSRGLSGRRPKRGCVHTFLHGRLVVAASGAFFPHLSYPGSPAHLATTTGQASPLASNRLSMSAPASRAHACKEQKNTLEPVGLRIASRPEAGARLTSRRLPGIGRPETHTLPTKAYTCL